MFDAISELLGITVESRRDIDAQRYRSLKAAQ